MSDENVNVEEVAQTEEVGKTETTTPNAKTKTESTPSVKPTDVSKFTTEQNKQLIAHAEKIGKSIKEVIKSGWQPTAEPEQEDKPVSKKPASKEEIKAAPTEKPTKQEPVSKYKVKVDGQEMEVELSELIKNYSLNKAANKRMQEGANARKQVEEFLTMMRDPDKVDMVLEKLGHKPRELYEKRLVAQLEEEMMDPRDKELKLARQKLKSIEDMEKAQQKALEDARAEEMKQKFVKDYEEQFKDALAKTEVPPTNHTVARMAKYISQSAKIGFKMTALEAAQLVKEDIKQEQLSLIANADGELLLKLLGDETASKILQARGKKAAKTTNYNHVEKGDPALLENKNNGKKYMTHSERRRWNNS